MPEEITTAPTPVPAPAPAGRTAARSLGIGCAVLVAVPLLLVLTFLGWLAVVTKDASDFPRVAPEERVDRTVDRSREAYDVLGFTRTIRPGVEQLGVSTENTIGTDHCYRGGLTDEFIGGAYRVSHSWALDHVTAEQAIPGMRRLRDHLEDTGWDVTTYRENVSGDLWDLFASRADGDERVSFQWFADREYFTGGASTPCAVDPDWRQGDDEPAGEELRAPDFGPSARANGS
ncbi:hypothetical protein J2X68_001451 [Streptomyces sp. 3330]|uniref:hypothetical protein n=1 Tax=Streptomyces sp. 3330 TaxID=2817755 RepID=UPI00285CDD99|nr:hypothetical protein [Streptomyces sp. 3330]MDR6974773.1 hypothetical protein [Streptomyces sp. 3330]